MSVFQIGLAVGLVLGFCVAICLFGVLGIAAEESRREEDRC